MTREYYADSGGDSLFGIGSDFLILCKGGTKEYFFSN